MIIDLMTFSGYPTKPCSTLNDMKVVWRWSTVSNERI